MIDTGRGDTAVVLAKSKLGKTVLEEIFTTYDERHARGLPQSPLPLEYRGLVANST